MQHLRPIILITVYRRFLELEKNVAEIRKQFDQFKIEPVIVVVWAAPVVGYYWFFQKLLADKQIQKLIHRPNEGLDGKTNVSYLESRNLRTGLNFIKSNYKNYYVIGQAADILPKNNVYKYIDSTIQDENTEAILFFWNNGIINDNAWHTNFFVVKENPEYWPPISEANEHDTLEVQWGKRLIKENYYKFVRNHNSRNRKFDHVHESDNLNFPVYPQKHDSGVCFYIMGYKSLYRKIAEFIKGFFTWQK